MKKSLKVMTLVLAILLVASALVGCANIEKKKAFLDYQASLGTDSAMMDSMSEDMNKVQDAIRKNDLTTTKAILQSRINPTLKQLSQNATNRHSTITDVELANVDTHYVNYCSHMSDAFTMMLDAVNTQDQAKLNKAVTELDVAMTEISSYADGLQKYMDSYGIKDDGSLAAFKSLIGN